jgi:hypothetical protein
MERPHRDSGPGGQHPPSTEGRPIVSPVPGSRLAAAAREAQSQRERVALSVILCPTPEKNRAP